MSSAAHQQLGIVAALLVGALYTLIGLVFALPTHQVQMWRLAAWVVSAILFAAHISYEHFQLHSRPGSAALHVAAAVGAGGFGLAVAATVHSLFVTPNYSRWRFVGALLAWPLITALPAFVVAIVLSTVLSRIHVKRSQE